MPSMSLQRWRTTRASALDQIESAHRSVGGTRPGRRHATEPINQAYAVLLSSQFQGFCRDLHSEGTDTLVQGITPVRLRLICRNAIVQGRKLDQGNPNPGNLGSDFGRFGMEFWNVVRSLDSRNRLWQDQLVEMNSWRNAVAHQDFASDLPGGRSLRLGAIFRWRKACDRLSIAFDQAMAMHVHSVTGAFPW